MEAYIATICVFGFNFAPRGWIICSGQLLSISSNTPLFSLIGTYYGGNGTTTFGLPNLQGRAAIHQGTLAGGSTYTMGEFSGTDSTSVLISNMPPHTHTLSYSLKANASAPNQGSPVNNFPATNGDKPFSAASTGAMPGFNMTLASQGGNVPISISDPSLVMNYCICTEGIYPSRN
jgi:microcystin-dependent protein